MCSTRKDIVPGRDNTSRASDLSALASPESSMVRCVSRRAIVLPPVTDCRCHSA